MRRHLAALVTTTALVLAACGSDADEDPLADRGDPTTSTRSSDDAAGADGGDGDRAPLRVELLDPGSEPRRVLRLDPPEGCEQAMTLRNASQNTVELMGQSQDSSSAIAYDVTYLCDVVQDDRIEVRTRYDDARIEDADPAGREAIEQMLGGIVGSEARSVYDRHGRILELDAPEIELDDDVLGPEFAAAMQQMLDGLESSIDQTASPLPEDAVGVGARWRSTGSMSVAGMETRLITEYLVTELSDALVVATTTLRMEIEPGPLEMAGVPGTVEVRSGGFEGTGTTTWDLGQVVAQTEQVLDGTTVMRVDAGDGDEVEMRQTMHQETSVLPR